MINLNVYNNIIARLSTARESVKASVYLTAFHSWYSESGWHSGVIDYLIDNLLKPKIFKNRLNKNRLKRQRRKLRKQKRR